MAYKLHKAKNNSLSGIFVKLRIDSLQTMSFNQIFDIWACQCFAHSVLRFHFIMSYYCREGI